MFLHPGDDHPQQPLSTQAFWHGADTPPIHRVRRVYHHDGTVERLVDPEPHHETIYTVGVRRMELAAVCVASLVLGCIAGYVVSHLTFLLF